MSENSHFDINTLISCLSIWCFVYGIIIFAVEITNVAVFVCLISGPITSYFLLKYFSLKRSDYSKVIEILGIDIKEDGEKVDKVVNSILGNNTSDSTEDVDVFLVNAIAHRFAGIDAPENSLRALEECYQKGCIAVEFDVALTKDKIPIVYHDNTLDRLANVSGEISQMTWEKLQNLDISVNHPFHEKFKGTKIALLEDIIQKCVEYDLRMIVDLKDSSSEMAEIMFNIFNKYPSLYKRAIVSSFNPVVIYMIREKNPSIVGAMAWRPYFMSCSSYSPIERERKRYYASTPMYLLTRVADIASTWLFNNIYYDFLGLSAVLLHKDIITPDVINWWQARGIRVLAWSVNIPSEKLHFSKNLQITYLTDTMAGD